jgi:tetratricopeptide (TPR) repeat protein
MTPNDQNKESFLEKRAYGEINKVLMGDDSGSLDRAISLLTDCINNDGQNPWIYNNRGFAYFIKGEPFLAISDMENAVSLDPDTPFFSDNLHYLLEQYKR